MKSCDLVIVGEGAAARAALEYAVAAGAMVEVVGSAGAVRRAPGGWCVAGWRTRAVLLAGPEALALWRGAGGRVVVNPALGRIVPVAGCLPAVEVAGVGLGVEGPGAEAKSGRFRARKLLRALASAPPDMP